MIDGSKRTRMSSKELFGRELYTLLIESDLERWGLANLLTAPPHL